MHRDDVMSELTGGLIQMNSHMVVTQDANTMIVGGMIAAVVFAVMLIVVATDKVTDKAGERLKLKRVALFAVLTLLAGVVAIIGANQPRVKEIHACASGPLSLERVASVYEIVCVDGSELVLREK